MTPEDPQEQQRPSTVDKDVQADLLFSPEADNQRRQELVKTYIGTVVSGPNAARRFNDLIAKTLKLKRDP